MGVQLTIARETKKELSKSKPVGVTGDRYLSSLLELAAAGEESGPGRETIAKWSEQIERVSEETADRVERRPG